MSRQPSFPMYAMALVLLLSSASAHAAETQWWVTNTPSDHVKAEASGVLVTPEGVLRPGPRTDRFPTDSLEVAWSMAVLADGSIAVGGDHGRVLRWNATQGWRVWARLGSGQVLALLADGDGAIVGTGPRGLVYRLSAKGDTTRLAETGERYIWGLAPAGKGAWYAATGTRGRLLRIADGQARTLLDIDEDNLVSLVADGQGGVYAGGDSHGRIVHVDANGVASTLYDAPESEIRSLARSSDGTVFAAALTNGAATDDASGDDGPQPSRATPSGGRSGIYRITPQGQASVWWVSPQPMVFSLLMDRDRLFATTGNRAAVYEVERAHRATQWAALAAGQVTAMVAGTKGERFAVTSNPVALVRFSSEVATGGTLTTSSFDAQRFSTFGRLRADVQGKVTFQTRTGNAEVADTTWTAWRALGAEGAIASPPGRFLQWRARFEDRDASIDEVAVSWREANQPPRVEDVSVAPQGQGFRDGDLMPRSESVTQSLSSGQKVAYSATMGVNKPLREMPLWARGLRTLQWRGTDPNGDALQYDVFLRSEPEGAWIRIGHELDASLLTWNTNTLNDGRYRVKVVATDAPGNAIGEGLTAESVSEPFRIDNTPPVIPSLEAIAIAAGVRVKGAAQDGQGRLARLDLATDDGDWRSVTPDGGLADQAELSFTVVLPDLEPGTHLISMRAVDEAGNAVTRAVQVAVPGARAK